MVLANDVGTGGLSVSFALGERIADLPLVEKPCGSQFAATAYLDSRLFVHLPKEPMVNRSMSASICRRQLRCELVGSLIELNVDRV